MNTYEGMFLILARLDEKGKNAVFDQIKQSITKNEGDVISSRIWAEKRMLSFAIKKQKEATYYLVNFKLKSDSVDKIIQDYRLNENILRVLITRTETSG